MAPTAHESHLRLPKCRELILLAIPVLLLSYFIATFRSLQAGGMNTTSNTTTVRPIPISLVLKQNLKLAARSWEHGVLIHALLELQNPELTVFAGPGYGFDLRKPLQKIGGETVILEAFPQGKLPKCAAEGRSTNWGRYDQWTKVKGLRYAASKIQTTKRWLIEDERDMETGSAADAASLGWATLLLESANAVDPANPVRAGHNIFGEAADLMVKWLLEDNLKFVPEETDPKFQAEGGHLGTTRQTMSLRKVGSMDGRKWAISHRIESKQLWADSVFMVPPFLAAYAVARQNVTFLWEAVEQIKAHEQVLGIKIFGVAVEAGRNVPDMVNKQTATKGLWKHIVTQPRLLEGKTCCHDEGFWLTGNAWALAGIVRVLGVLERWKPVAVTGDQSNSQLMEYLSTRDIAITELRQIAQRMLSSLRSQELSTSDLLPNYLEMRIETEVTSTAFGDAAGSALVASSVYRLTQLGMLSHDRIGMLRWADKLYNAVADCVGNSGLLGSVATVTGVPAKFAVDGTSEGQSFALMMYAARRDCIKLAICSGSEHQRPTLA